MKFEYGQFHPILYWTCDYLSMLGFKLIQVSKRVPWYIVSTMTVCKIKFMLTRQQKSLPPNQTNLIKRHIDKLVQERRNSSANALELRLSCANQSIRNLGLSSTCTWIPIMENSRFDHSLCRHYENCGTDQEGLWENDLTSNIEINRFSNSLPLSNKVCLMAIMQVLFCVAWFSHRPRE